jgi:hypothetical protein
LVVRAPKKIARLSLAAAVLSFSGCQPAGLLARTGVAVAPPASWRPVRPSPGKVPGVPLAAWAGPEGSALVVYRDLPAPGVSPAMLADALGNRLAHLAGLEVVVKRTETVGEALAARVEVIAPGTGDGLAPSGTGMPIAPDGKVLVPTREVIVGFPRPDATIYLMWDAPEASYGRIEPEIKATLESVEFSH